MRNYVGQTCGLGKQQGPESYAERVVRKLRGRESCAEYESAAATAKPSA